MKLIDRYIYSVKKYLPEEYREDVGKELRANIEDMLPEHPTEKDEYEVLEQLGNPWKLANEYHPKKRYLIGPGFYDKYLSVLKLVVGIGILVAVGIGIITWGWEISSNGFAWEDLIKLFTNLMVAVWEGALQGALWVTIIFIILERSGVEPGNISFTNKQWTPDDLADIPDDSRGKISRGESIFSIIFTILFTSIIYFTPEVISLYLKNESGGIDRISFFNIEVLQKYLTVILFLAILQIGIYAWKLLSGYWNQPLAIVNAIYNVALTILMIVMLNHNSLYNSEFLRSITKYLDTVPENIGVWMNASKWVFIVFFVGIILWDSILAFIHCSKRNME